MLLLQLHVLFVCLFIVVFCFWCVVVVAVVVVVVVVAGAIVDSTCAWRGIEFRAVGLKVERSRGHFSV